MFGTGASGRGPVGLGAAPAERSRGSPWRATSDRASGASGSLLAVEGEGVDDAVELLELVGEVERLDAVDCFGLLGVVPNHVEAVYRTVPAVHRLPLLWLDWSGASVGSVDNLRVSDYDEPLRRVRLRASVSKSRRALWVDLPDELADAIHATLPPREDRDPDARLFDASRSNALRTAIAKACRALAIPLWSPHDLRHRRVSLLHRQGRSWAQIGQFVGQRNLAVTANAYTHVLLDDRELDYRGLLAGSA